MGARAWLEVESWAGSIEGCLNAAQVRLLESDEIHEIVGTRSDIENRAMEIGDLGIPELVEIFEAALQRYDINGRPQTAADVHALRGIVDHGTGTILDVSRVDTDPRRLGDPSPSEFEFLVSPLAVENLIAAFDSAEPTVQQIREYEFANDLDTFDGRYVVLYDGGSPTTVVFFGVSTW